MTGFSGARILEMFEIEQRHWARGRESPEPEPGQRCSDLALSAGMAAMRTAGVHARDLGALITVTTTPDSLNPPPDAIVAQGLGVPGLLSFSLHAPCTGAFRAVQLATGLLPLLDGRPVLIAAAETFSPFFRFGPAIPTEHVLNSILYADGAGAVVVAPATSDRPNIECVDLHLNSDDAPPGITFPGMLSARPPTEERFSSADYLGHHDFRRVLRRGSKLAAGAASRVMERLGLRAEDVRHFVTHQATGNLRRIASAYGLPPEKIAVNIHRVGNTVSASVLILLDELVKDGAVARGDVLILHAAESSTWSSAGMAIRW
ncbi:MAG TPA: 3-oxoacyl-[acyl-carrier-protein] synthase III C-terminal domain-containing protein [Candidatus Binatia bacterium]